MPTTDIHTPTDTAGQTCEGLPAKDGSPLSPIRTVEAFRSSVAEWSAAMQFSTSSDGLLSRTLQMSEHSGYLFIGGPLDGERIAVPEGKLEYVHPHPNANCEGGMEVHRYLREHLIDGRARLWVVYTADYVNGLELMYSRYPSPKTAHTVG